MRGYLRERDRGSTTNRTGAEKTLQLVADSGAEFVDGVRKRKQEYRSFFGTRREAEEALPPCMVTPE